MIWMRADLDLKDELHGGMFVDIWNIFEVVS